MEVNEPAVKYEAMLAMSPGEYVEWETTEEYKHEYTGGRVIAMAGASIAHNKISTNIMRKVSPFLAGHNCEIYPADLRVFVKAKESFFYPDATIVCGEIELAENFTNTIKNPSVVFEILSPSTENYDLGKKLFMYMQIETLKEFIAIDSTTTNIKISRRKNNNLWQFEEFTKLEDAFEITAIQQTLLLHEIYNEVKFN